MTSLPLEESQKKLLNAAEVSVPGVSCRRIAGSNIFTGVIARSTARAAGHHLSDSLNAPG